MYEWPGIVHKAAMSAGSPIRAYEAMRGWWAIAVRALSLVLALALVAPGTIHSAEVHRFAGAEVSMSAYSDAAPASHADGCQTCHANCGCHQAINPEGPALALSAMTKRPTYALVDATMVSVSPDRLPRPPRA